MTFTEFIRAMPKVELHVHLQGATQPETWLELARRNHITLPADDLAGMHEWFKFTDFPHFLKVYIKVCECIRTPEDVEWLTREFLAGQARQNIRYTEFTYTPHIHYKLAGLQGDQQLAALNRGRAWAQAELGVESGIILDISRNVTPEEGLWTADLAISGRHDGVVALGLGGPEVGHPPEKHAISFAKAHAAGLRCVLHAGETEGAASIWGALHQGSLRIGHGVRCFEDPALVDYLREKQIPLEVSPTSNICLNVFPRMEDHPLPKLIEAGLYVTLNSDDPPMFNTTLTDEFLTVARVFNFDTDTLTTLVMKALRASFLPAERKATLEAEFVRDFAQLKQTLL